MTGTTYLDVSVVRVQTYLARTAQLRLRRGASTMIVQATANERWEDGGAAGPPAGWTPNPEAGDLSGVVALRWHGPGDPGETDVESAARAVASELRRLLPQAHLRAVVRTGPSYAEAYSAPSRPVLDSPPPAPEVVLAARCDWCNAAPALAESVRDERAGRDRHVCDDCRLRKQVAGNTAGREKGREPATEARFLSCVAAVSGTGEWRCPDDFAELARSSGPTANHVATVFADGNRVGAFLTQAAQGQVPKDEIVEAIDTASARAVARAALAALPHDDGYVPCIVHVLGGDDILVSVPAASGWRFTTQLLRLFSDELEQQTSSHEEWKAVSSRPTISAGVVFHQHTAPFADVVHLAEKRLQAAKRAVQGAKPSAAFLDLTADGMAVPEGRRPHGLDRLDELSSDLGDIAALPQSARHVYRQRCDDGAAAVKQQVLDNDRSVPGHAAVDRRIAGLDDEQVPVLVGTLMDLARWWPPRTTDPEDAP